MSNIVEILGEKKFSGSKPGDIKSSIVLEETNQMRYDNNLFYTVSQQTQFIDEKRNCGNFRIYGKINPIIALDVHKKTTAGYKKINVDNNLFDLNLDNWSIVVLKSKRIETGLNSDGKQTYSKGIKRIIKHEGDDPNKGKILFNLDLKNGLPAKTYKSNIYTDNYGLYFPLGHNFSVGDRIKIDSLAQHKIPNGFYNVEIVDSDRIYINYQPYEMNRALIPTSISTKGLEAINLADVIPPENSTIIKNNEELKSTMVVGNLSFSSSVDSIKNLSALRPKIAPFTQPEFYITKIQEKEALEYYVKVLEVIDIIDEIDDCGFSKNFMNQQVKSFFLNKDLSLDGLTNNKNEPLVDIYIGIIKNASVDSKSYTTVEAHFSDFIDHVSDGDGLQTINKTISYNDIKNTNKKPKIGDTFYYCVCEHSTEELTEVELGQIYHRFIHRDVLFNYKPFYKINLKLKSPYIEDGDANISGIPAHAVYSRQREKYIWRDIFDVGVADDGGNVIDFPFMNNALYVFNQINFFVKSEKSATKSFKLNLNDITNNSNGGNELNSMLSDILDDMNLNEKDPNTKPYNQYKEEKC